jgi:hypothetical protein
MQKQQTMAGGETLSGISQHVSKVPGSDMAPVSTRMAAAASKKAPPSATSTMPGQFDLTPKPLSGSSGSSVFTPEAKPLCTTQSASPDWLKRHLEHADENKERTKPYEGHARLLHQ